MTLYCCGVDEAGRGPLAGPVYAAAVILRPDHVITGLADSKKLSEKARDRLEIQIKEHAHAWCIASASVEEIDQLNILQASFLAMARAVEGLGIPATDMEVLVDGNRLPKWSWCSRAIVGGDAVVAEISAASILAKTARDAEMLHLHEAYPQYGFDQHKGYPTASHRQALQQFGVSPVHRRSYGPVKQQLQLL